MKKIVKMMVLFLGLLILPGCNKKQSENSLSDEGEKKDVLKVVLLVNGNLGDLSFFDSADKGMKLLQEKCKDKIKTKTVEASSDDTKWFPSLEDLSEQGWDVIIVGTFLMVEMLEKIAPEYPDKKYIIFDGAVDYSLGNLSNVYSITYKQNEAAFLAGALATRITTSDDPITNSDKKIGFLGGLDIPVINDFLVGYIEGAKYIDPDVIVLFSYVGDFNDSAKGKEIALVQYNQGVDIGFNVAGTAGLGQLDAVKQAHKYAIGVDGDQAILFEDSDPIKSKLIVTSILKRVDNSLVRAIDKHINKTLPYGSLESLGFAEDAVGFALNKYYKAVVSKKIQQEILDIKTKISSQEIIVGTAFKMSREKLTQLKDSVR